MEIKKIVLIIIILLIIVSVFIFGINLYVKLSTKEQIIKNKDYSKLNDIDCILVLGCGIWGDKPSPMLEDRLNEGISLYENGVAGKIIMSGDHGREEYNEVNVMKKYAIDKGVSSEDIFMDHAGFSTYESIYRVKEIFGAKKIVIVTQEYHLYRALYIANRLGIDAYGVNSDPRQYVGATYRELREILARDKDWIKCIFKPEPTYLGDTIEVSGNGDVTNDKLEPIVDKIDYEKSLLNSVVNIYSDSGDFGAGFAYKNGYIITNYHVVYNSKDIKVVTYSRDECSASLVGYDYDNDIAVLKIEKQLEPIVLGNSDEVKVGDTITAIGNPNEDLSFSEAKGKVLNLDEQLLNKIDKERKYIWYDGNAISGYSGGPVYDKEGKIIGMLNSAYLGDLSKYDFDNLCGIIPIKRAKTIIDSIIENNQ